MNVFLEEIKNYVRESGRTSNCHNAFGTVLMCDQYFIDNCYGNAISGLYGEFGETVDLFKKAIYHDREILREKFVDELGDILWYATDSYRIRLAENQSTIVDLESLVDNVAEALCEYIFECKDSSTTMFLTISKQLMSEGCRDYFVGKVYPHVEKILEDHNITATEVMRFNVAKLKARYPNGFVKGGGVR